jgi:hypothetical protein
MPKLIDMKLEADERYDGMVCCGSSNYPGGLAIWLNEDQCEALGITRALKPGTELTLSAKAIVTTSSESLERDGDDKGTDVSLNLQIIELGATVGGVVRGAAEVLYGSSGD